MGKEIQTTTEISVMSEEIKATGFVTEGAQEEAIKAKELQVKEKIRNLKRLYYIDGSISLKQREEELHTIQQEIQDDITALKSDPDMDILF